MTSIKGQVEALQVNGGDVDDDTLRAMLPRLSKKERGGTLEASGVTLCVVCREAGVLTATTNEQWVRQGFMARLWGNAPHGECHTCHGTTVCLPMCMECADAPHGPDECKECGRRDT